MHKRELRNRAKKKKKILYKRKIGRAFSQSREILKFRSFVRVTFAQASVGKAPTPSVHFLSLSLLIFFPIDIKKSCPWSVKNLPFFPSANLARTPDDYYVFQVNSDISLSAHANIAFRGKKWDFTRNFFKSPEITRENWNGARGAIYASPSANFASPMEKGEMIELAECCGKARQDSAQDHGS